MPIRKTRAAFVISNKPGGSGLGLAIVRKVVEDHDGSICVDKEEAGGTTFTIRLPLPQDEDAE